MGQEIWYPLFSGGATKERKDKMVAIVCLDDKNGMCFNGRRQSRDVCLRSCVMDLAKGKRLWMSPYSAEQFAEAEGGQICVSTSFLEEAGPGDYAFVEDRALAPFAEKLEKLVVFRWNRVYPGDQYLDLDLTKGPWRKTEERDFPGKSHERITMEVSTR